MSAKDEATLVELAAELRAARDIGLETRDIEGRINACIAEINRV